jgi:hypothetical protein
MGTKGDALPQGQTAQFKLLPLGDLHKSAISKHGRRTRDALNRAAAEPTPARVNPGRGVTLGGVDAGVLAVFAFPLHIGAIRIGVLVLYRDRAGALSADELASGLVLADVATQVILMPVA